MTKPRLHIRRPYERMRVPTIIEGESATQLGHFDQTDVNAIIERFKRDGYLPPATRVAQYGDVTGLQVDLTEAFNRSQAVLAEAQGFAATWEPAQSETPAPIPAPAETPPPSA